MKALSNRQPWAGLVEHGLKSIEVRTWSTKHRGSLLICASAYKCRDDETGEYFPHGVMLAVVNLIDIRPLTRRDFLGRLYADQLYARWQGLGLGIGKTSSG